MERHLRSVAIMIEVTSLHMECTHFNLDCSQMPAVAPQQENGHCLKYNIQKARLTNDKCIIMSLRLITSVKPNMFTLDLRVNFKKNCEYYIL